MKVAALLISLAAATSWGIGGILFKRGLSHVSPATILVVQYAVGFGIVAVWLLARRESGSAAAAVGDRWGTILLIVLFQIGGYLLWTGAVHLAGHGSLPTATVIAIAASYPAIVAALSAPLLHEDLHWNHALGIALVVAGVIVTQVL